LQKLLGSHYRVRNFSVAGRSVLWKAEFPFTREKAYSEALAYKPELVLILLGSNDVLPQNWKYEKEFEMDYRRLIESFKVGFGKKRIILCTPTPDFESAAADPNQSILERELLPRIRRVGSDLKLPIVDLYTPLRGRPELFPDKFHPNEEGSKAIASLVFAAL
jgi:lysophospholipase L1-like esterase